MAGDLVYVVHSEREVAAKLTNALLGADFKVVAMTSESEADAALSGHRFVLPDAILTPLGDLESGDSILIKLFTASPLMEQIPVVVVAGDQGDERRRALRMGLLSVIMPPYDDEEVALTTQLAIEKHRSEHLLFGALSQLSVPDLLQTAEGGRRSGKITFQSNGHTGTVWLRDGRVVNVNIDGVIDSEEAVYAIALWNEGTFEANFSPVDVEERFEILPSELLLEAMRRFDEGLISPGDIPAPTIVETPEVKARHYQHMALVLVNAAACYSLNHLDGALLERRLDEVRRDLRVRHPVLDRFEVGEDGVVTVAAGAALDDVDACTAGVSRWLLRIFERLEGALAWRFTPKKLARVLAPWYDEARALGFLPDLERAKDAGDEDDESAADQATERALPLGVAVLEADGCVEEFSPLGYGHRGFDPRMLVGQELAAVLPPELAKVVRSGMATLAAGAALQHAVGVAEISAGDQLTRRKVRVALIRSPHDGRVIALVSRLRDESALFTSKIERDHFCGTLSDGGTMRILAANDDFLKAFDSLFAKSLAHRRHEILHRFGKKWGLLHALRVEHLVQHDYRMTLREVESQLAIEVLSASVGVMGLGRFKADLNFRERGVVVIRHHFSPFAAGPSGQGCCCSILAGFHAALLSYLAGRQLAARELRCARVNDEPCVFVVAIEERLSSLFTAAAGTPDQKLLDRISAEAGARTARRER